MVSRTIRFRASEAFILATEKAAKKEGVDVSLFIRRLIEAKIGVTAELSRSGWTEARRKANAKA